MRTKTLQFYYIMAQAERDVAGAVTKPATVFTDVNGLPIADTNRSRLEAKLDLLKSVSDDFVDAVIAPVNVCSISK